VSGVRFAGKTPRLFSLYNIAAFLAQRNWVFRLRDRLKRMERKSNLPMSKTQKKGVLQGDSYPLGIKKKKYIP